MEWQPLIIEVEGYLKHLLAKEGISQASIFYRRSLQLQHKIL
ncbi:MAG: hypothetical protein V7L00_17715 [Nostoc sp.]